jgi:hypothetical protein
MAKPSLRSALDPRLAVGQECDALAVTLVELPDPQGMRWLAALSLLLEAGEPVTEAKAG